jgi:hypothetical protein
VHFFLWLLAGEGDLRGLPLAGIVQSGRGGLDAHTILRDLIACSIARID